MKTFVGILQVVKTEIDQSLVTSTFVSRGNYSVVYPGPYTLDKYPGATDLICSRHLVNASVPTAHHWMCTRGQLNSIMAIATHTIGQCLIYVSIITVYIL